MVWNSSPKLPRCIFALGACGDEGILHDVERAVSSRGRRSTPESSAVFVRQAPDPRVPRMRMRIVDKAEKEHDRGVLRFYSLQKRFRHSNCQSFPYRSSTTALY
jgi:hypothetical protein